MQPTTSPARALAAALLLVSAAAATSPKAIRFGVSAAGVGAPPRSTIGWMPAAQLHKVLEKEFAPDGIEVKWIFFKGQGPAVNEAIANNQLDFTTLGDLPSIIGRSVGLDTRLVLVSGARSDTYVAVPPGSPVTRIGQLKGRRIAFHKGTATQLLANRVLEQHGLTEKDVKIVNMEPANAKAAFLAGQVDALFGALDLVRQQSQGKARIIWTSKDHPSAASSSHVLVNQRFAEKHPEHTRRVVKALLRAAHWAGLEANRDSVLKLWASAGTLPESLYRREYAGIPLSTRLSPVFDDFVVAADRRSVADAHRYRLIRKPFDVDAWIDRRYQDAAIKELGLEGFWPRFDKDGRRIASAGEVPRRASAP